MREVIGRSNIQAILTGARQTIETAVQELMQKTLDDYGAGVVVQQVQLQKVDPPAQVLDAFRDVQAARSDLERAANEAQTYANRIVPEARGRVLALGLGYGFTCSAFVLRGGLAFWSGVGLGFFVLASHRLS
jgi:modulator of FtsH protease HflK